MDSNSSQTVSHLWALILASTVFVDTYAAAVRIARKEAKPYALTNSSQDGGKFSSRSK
jgi:hypothetical protein